MAKSKQMKPSAWLLVSTLTLSLPSTNALSATTEEKLSACDAALTAKKDEARICDLGVKLYQNEIERVSKENARLREQGASWWNNPFVFAAIGVIVGAYAGARATR